MPTKTKQVKSARTASRKSIDSSSTTHPALQGNKVSSTLSKTEDGTIKLMLNIPQEVVEKEKEESIKHLAKDITIPGFRKGKAPKDKVKNSISANSIIEHTLQHLLPDAFSQAITQHKITPAVYPKFEIISVREDQDWQIQAITCELPIPQLGDYTKAIKNNSTKDAIWTPSKGGDKTKPADKSIEQKQQEALESILAQTKITIPDILIQEEVERRLSALLSRLENLGITLEAYLKNTNKTADQLKGEYKKQAQESITLELSLTQIAEKENIKVKEEEIDSAIQASGTTQSIQSLNTPQQRRTIKGILVRKKALDALTALV